MAIAASLVVRISAQYGAFQRGMEQAEKTLKRFGKQAQSAGRDLSTNLSLPLIDLLGLERLLPVLASSPTPPSGAPGGTAA